MMFDHPELFFLHTAGHPSSAAAFDAGNLIPATTDPNTGIGR